MLFFCLNERISLCHFYKRHFYNQGRTRDFRIGGGGHDPQMGPHADWPLAEKAAGAVLSILGAFSPRMGPFRLVIMGADTGGTEGTRPPSQKVEGGRPQEITIFTDFLKNLPKFLDFSRFSK